MNMMRGAAAYGRGAKAYAKVGVESGVMSASPYQLIVLLFDGLEAAMRAARLHLENGNVAEKGKSLSRALDILNQGLLAALDREQGGEVASNLAALYEYCSGLLLQANLRNDIKPLDEAERLLNEIATAWREIGQPGREE